MSRELLLVGNIPVHTAESVFRALGPSLGRWLAYLPDGEIVPEFGLAAPCGFGRAPERPGKLLSQDGVLPPDHLQAIVDGHIQAVGEL